MKKILTIFLLILCLTGLVLGQRVPNQKPMLGRQVDWSDPLSDFVAFWPMNESSGPTVYDLSGNGYDGIFDAILPPSWTTGKYGPAILFTGGRYLRAATPAITGDITIIFSTAPADPTVNDYILDFGGVDEFGCIVGYQDNYYNVYGGAYPTGNAADSQIPVTGAGITDLVAWTLSGTNLKGYVNGIEYISVTNSADLQPSALLDIGRRFNASEIYTGVIDFLYIYNRALTAGEIADLVENPFRFMVEDDDYLPLWYAALPTDVTFLMQVQHGNQKPMLGVSPNWGNSINDNTAVTFPLNEDSGDTVYDLANGDSIDFGASGTLWTHNIHGPALLFDGITGIVNTVVTPLPHEQGSFAGWVVDDYAGGAGFIEGGVYICLSDGTNQNRIILFSTLLSGTELKLVIKSGGVSTKVWREDPPPMVSGQFYHVVATWDTDIDDYHVYLDGQERTPTATLASAAAIGLDTVSLGSLEDTVSVPLGGIISQMTVYNKILTSQEVEELYNKAYGQYDYEQWFTTEEAAALVEFGQFIFIN